MLVAPGQLWFTMSVRGKVTQHAANRGQTLRSGEGVEPPRVSAIDKAFLLDAGLRRLEQEWAFPKCHPLYRSAQFTIMPEVIEGGTTGVQFPLFVPEFVRTEYLVRYPLDADADAVIAEIEAHVGAVAATDPRLPEHEPIDWRLHWPSNAPRAEAITAATCGAKQRAANRTRFAGRAQVTRFPAVADATWLTLGGIPAISDGRRDSVVAHADDEFVRVDEVLRVTRLRPACHRIVRRFRLTTQEADDG
jgi:acetylornithine deacetylase/succinyl-diaminopimelate desuccinylase-like protein